VDDTCIDRAQGRVRVQQVDRIMPMLMRVHCRIWGTGSRARPHHRHQQPTEVGSRRVCCFQSQRRFSSSSTSGSSGRSIHTTRGWPRISRLAMPVHRLVHRGSHRLRTRRRLAAPTKFFLGHIREC
jgi:hypothetical protein